MSDPTQAEVKRWLKDRYWRREGQAGLAIGRAYVRVVEILEDVAHQACFVDDRGDYDSIAISSYADALRFLAEIGVLEITTDEGRRVIARRRT